MNRAPYLVTIRISSGSMIDHCGKSRRSMDKMHDRNINRALHNNDRDWEVMKYEDYKRMTKTVTNLMSGKKVEIPLDTPLCCDPSSETYWSM